MCTGESVNMARRLVLDGPLIPAAASGEQRRFEAGFLLNWVEVADDALTTRDRAMQSFVSATHPTPDCLAISVTHPMLLLPLLTLVLPRWDDDRLLGTPGLRVYPWRDFLELRMLGVDNDVRARIRLYGVNRTRKQCRDLLAKVVQSWPACRPLYMERTLIPSEMARVGVPATRLDSVLSGLLRRFPLWRTADRVSINPSAMSVGVCWRGSPDATTVSAVLESPSCGIPNTVRDSSSHDGVHEIKFLFDGSCELGMSEPWEAWEAIHAVQAAGRNRVTVAPCRRQNVVVPEAWEHPEMRAALAQREVSTIYKLLRRKGVSQRQIAAMTGQSQSEVSEILKGRQVMAYDVLLRIADGLGVPRGYMGLAYDEVPAARVAKSDEAPEAEEPENVKRRKFLAHAATVYVGASSGSWTSNPVLPSTGERIGMVEVRQMEAATRALRSLDYQYGSEFCRDAVVAQKQWVMNLLDKAEDVEIRRRLVAVIAQLNAIGTGLWVPGDPWSSTETKGGES
jgi:transcriptional regulator with XRE-family HTH domain